MGALQLGQQRYSPTLLIMDCDGVIFDVNPGKIEAFAAAIAQFPPEAVAEFIAHHKAHGGVSRYDKFQRFFHQIVSVPDPEEQIALALQRYGDASEAAYAALQPRDEALALADSFGAANSYVVSGSDEKELRGIFERKGIANRFAEICGSPARKPAHLQRILSERGVSGSDALFIGDGRADFEAARGAGIPFIFLAEMSDWADGAEELAGAPQTYLAASWATVLSWIDR